jgi:hypothetical protein
MARAERYPHRINEVIAGHFNDSIGLLLRSQTASNLPKDKRKQVRILKKTLRVPEFLYFNLSFPFLPKVGTRNFPRGFLFLKSWKAALSVMGVLKIEVGDLECAIDPFFHKFKI